MIGDFIYKETQASTTFGLICKSISRPLLPALKSNVSSLVGTSGVYDTGSTEYELRNITMKLQYLGTDFYELRTRAREIAAWLGGGTWEKLSIIGEEDKYYLAKIEEEIPLDTLFEFGEADVPFVAQPFAYGNDLTFSGGSSVQINNPGTRYIDSRSPEGSRFDISFNGPATLMLNGRTLSYNASGNVTIDNVAMKVIGGTFNNLGDDIDLFLRVNPGNNNLVCAGASGVTVTIRPMYY